MSMTVEEAIAWLQEISVSMEESAKFNDDEILLADSVKYRNAASLLTTLAASQAQAEASAAQMREQIRIGGVPCGICAHGPTWNDCLGTECDCTKSATTGFQHFQPTPTPTLSALEAELRTAKRCGSCKWWGEPRRCNNDESPFHPVLSVLRYETCPCWEAINAGTTEHGEVQHG